MLAYRALGCVLFSRKCRLRSCTATLWSGSLISDIRKSMGGTPTQKFSAWGSSVLLPMSFLVLPQAQVSSLDRTATKWKSLGSVVTVLPNPVECARACTRLLQHELMQSLTLRLRDYRQARGGTICPLCVRMPLIIRRGSACLGYDEQMAKPQKSPQLPAYATE